MPGKTVVINGVQKVDLVMVVNDTQTEVLKNGVLTKLHAKQGDKVKIIQHINDEDILADNVIVVRSGDALELSYADQTVLSIENFYTTNQIAVELPTQTPNASFTLNSSTMTNVQSLADGTNFIYSSGDIGILSQMSATNPTLQLALHEHMDFMNAPRFADAGNIATDALPVSSAEVGAIGGGVAAGGIGATQILLGALAIGGVAAVAGGGGGGSSTPATPLTPADTTAPTATITMSDTALKIGETATVTITFNEAVTNFSNADVTSPNGTLSPFTSSNNITWTATFTPTMAIEDSTNIITLATSYTDVAGNVGTTATSANYAIDTVAPVLTGVLAHGVSGTVVLTYDSPLDATHPPLLGDFAITTGGAANAVTSITVSGNTITLTLTNTFLTTDAVAINYTGSGANAIQDIAGNDAIAITNLGSGVVADGYVRGAQLWIDTNHDGVADYNTHVTTDDNGNFFLPPSTPAGSIIAIGGVNIDTGVPNTMPLSAPEGSTVINPLTTLVQAVIASNTGMSTADASASVVAALGLDNGTDLTTFDPIQSNNLVAQQAAATIATISIMAETSTADASAQTTIMNNLVTQVNQSSQSGTAVNLSDSGVVGSLLNGVSGLDLTAESNIIDASNAVSTASDLAAISQAQSQYLDTIAPGSSTINITTPTNDTTPSVKVNLDVTSTAGAAAVVNDHVALIVDGVEVATTTISSTNISNGYITFDAPTLTEGTHTISARVIDQSGNIGSAYANQTITIDTTAPTAPTIATVTADNVINIAEKAAGVTISGITEAGSSVTINGANATVNGTTWSYTLTSAAILAMGEGAETLTIVSTDLAGNTATTTHAISVDTIRPTNTVTIASITDNVDPNTGAITAGSTTNDNTLDLAGTLSGALAVGDKLAIYDGAVLKGYATVNGTDWTFTTSSLSNTAHNFTSVVIDAAGNSGIASTAFAVTVNATVPTTIATITNNIAISNNTAPTLAGTVDTYVNGEKVIIYDGTTKIGEVTLTGTAWSFDASGLTEGTHTFSAIVENAGGNQGTQSSSYALTIDTTNPIAPTIAKVASDDIINLAEQTAGVTISGTTEVGSTVTVNGNAAIVTGSTWSYTLNTATIQAMGEGAETLTIVSTDTAGNTATTTKNISVDTNSSAIMIDPISNDNAINQAEKASSAFVSGTAEANTTIILELGTNNTKSITTESNGTWSYILGDADYKALGTTATIKATAVDSAGNTSVATQGLTIDTIAPVLSAITLATVSDTGILGDRKSNDTTPDFTFTAENGANIAYSLDGSNYSDLGTGTGSVQTLSIPALPSDGNYTIFIKATDTAGNATVRSTTYTLDATAPSAPSVTLNSDTGSSSSDSISKTSVVNVTSENGATVEFSNDGSTWTTTQPTATQGTNTLHVRQTDAAGNISAVTDFNFTYDSVAPSAPVVTLASDTGTSATDKITQISTVNVTSENGATVEFSSDGSTWTTTQPTATQGANTLHVRQTDAAGNISAVTDFTFTYDSVAPSAPNVTLTSDTGTSSADSITKISAVNVASANGATVEFSSDNTNWFTTQPTASEGANTLHVRQTDTAGNISATTDFAFTLDTTVPTATITLDDSALKIGDTSTVTITFSEAVAAFALADLTAPNGLLSNLQTTDNITFTATFTPTASIEATTNIISLATTYTDIAGNVGTIATSANYAIDTLAPSITINAISNGYVNDTEDESAVSIAGTTSGVEDGQTVTVTLNSVDYTATVTSNTWTLDVDSSAIKALSQGEITLVANVSDLAGNSAIQASQTFVYDTTAPTISSNSAVNVSENVATTTAVYTATADGTNTYSLGGTDASLFNINATTGAVTFVTSPDFENPTDTSVDNVYDITVTATDAAGNASAAQNVAITVENVDVTINNVATDNIINAAEKMAGVVITGTNEPNATVTVNGNAATVTGTSWSYTLNASAISALGEGTQTLTISSGGQTITQDITIDTIVPTATITMADSALNVGETTLVTITFSEAVANFSNADVTVANGILEPLTTSDNIIWTAIFTPTVNLEDASNVITLATSYTDNIGNAGTIATSTNYTIDTLAPAAPIVSLVTDAGPSATDKITNIATLSLSNAEVGAIVEFSSDGSTWTTTQPTATQGENTLHVRQTDVAGNVSDITDFTFTYDTLAPTTIDGNSGIYKITDDHSVIVNNVNGAFGAKLVLTSDNTIKVGQSASFDGNGDSTISVGEQASLTNTRAVAYDNAGNAIKSMSHIFLGTANADTITADTTYGDVFFGFGGTDTFVLKAGSSTATLADFTAGEKIDLGVGETLWSSANAPTNWSVDANGMATYTADATNIPDLATQFFTDFKAATGSVGAVVGFVGNGRTYIFGEGATTADTDNYQTRIINTDTTTGLEIVNGTVQLLGLPTPVAFDITSLLSSGATFFEAYPEDLESSTITVQGTSGTYTDYSYDGSSFTLDGNGGTIGIVNNSGTLTVTGIWGTQTITFSNAHTVPSIDSIDTTGLNQVTATFTVISVPTVATTTDWWVSGYDDWTTGSAVPFASLVDMVTVLTNPSNGYSICVGENNLHVKLQSDGTLHLATGSDETGWSDSDTVIAGSWTNDNTYLTISVDTVGTTAFTMDGTTMMETEIDAVGTVYTETWYYGVDESQFQSVLSTIYDANTSSSSNNPPMLTLYDGENLGLVVDENTTDVQTFTAQDSDNDTLMYSLSGLDASAFDISSTGVLTFKTAPNYENPTDSGGNNVYDVTVVVSDGHGDIDTQSVSVHVKDINEGVAISGFDATTMINAGQANFFTLYEGGQEFEYINLNNATAGSWNDYLYTTPFFALNESGNFSYVDNGNNTLTITSNDEGGKVETLVLSNAQTAVSSGGEDISGFGFNQVTATFTVTTASDLASTTDWWESGYTTNATTLTELRDAFIDTNNTYSVWVNDHIAVELRGTAGSTTGSLIELVWDGTYSTWTDANNVEHTTQHLVEGAVADGSWTLDSTYLTVHVNNIGDAVFKVDNGTIMETEIAAVGSTHSETLFYSDTITTAIDFGNTLGLNNTNIVGYEGIITQDSGVDTLTLAGSVSLDLSGLSSIYNGALGKINALDDGSTPDTIILTAADVLRLGVNDTLTIDINSNDTLDLSAWTAGTEVNGYVPYTLDIYTLQVHTAVII
ncbi:MAG: Ig-like domain-containing protein [Sulfurospirillaceae bacterium]|nr:Ig-like domain-containing protein [Sulfurospirillaceae bacterium]MDD2825946.1 Ig-like domain-containing protein [Sulfurospirillaceae bacterium]